MHVVEEISGSNRRKNMNNENPVEKRNKMRAEKLIAEMEVEKMTSVMER